MKKLLYAAFALVCLPAFGQGVRYDNQIFTAATNGPVGSSAPVMTTPGATVSVCSVPAVGNPCTNIVAIYGNPALTVTQANPFKADAAGRFGFYAAPGNYVYSIVDSTGKLRGTFPITLGGTSAGTTFTGGVVANPIVAPQVTVAADPTTSLQVATKHYVDTSIPTTTAHATSADSATNANHAIIADTATSATSATTATNATNAATAANLTGTITTAQVVRANAAVNGYFDAILSNTGVDAYAAAPSAGTIRYTSQGGAPAYQTSDGVTHVFGSGGGTASIPGTSKVIVGSGGSAVATNVSIDPVTAAVSGITSMNSAAYNQVNTTPSGQAPQQVPVNQTNTVTQRYALQDFGGVASHTLNILSGTSDMLLDSNNGNLNNFFLTSDTLNKYASGQIGGAHSTNIINNTGGDTVDRMTYMLAGANTEGFSEGGEVDRILAYANNTAFNGILTMGAADAQGRQAMQVAVNAGYSNNAIGADNFIVNRSKVFSPAGNVTSVTPGTATHTLTVDATLKASIQAQFGATDTHTTTLTANADEQKYNTSCPSTVIAPNYGTTVVNGQTLNVDPYASDITGAGAKTNNFCLTVASTATLTPGTIVGIFGIHSNVEYPTVISVADATHFVAALNYPHDSGETVSWGAGIPFGISTPSSIITPGTIPGTTQYTQTGDLLIAYPIVKIVNGNVYAYNYGSVTASLFLNLYASNTPTTAGTATGTFSGGSLTSLTFTSNDYRSPTRVAGLLNQLPPPTLTTACTVQPTYSWSPNYLGQYTPTILTGGSGCSVGGSITVNNTYANPITIFPMSRIFRAVDATGHINGYLKTYPVPSASWTNGDTVQQVLNPNIFIQNQHIYYNQFSTANSGHVGATDTYQYFFPQSNAPYTNHINATPMKFYFSDAAHGYTVNASAPLLGTFLPPQLHQYNGAFSVANQYNLPPYNNSGASSGSASIQGGSLNRIACQPTGLGGYNFADAPCARGLYFPYDLFDFDTTSTHRGITVDEVAGTISYTNLSLLAIGFRASNNIETNSGSFIADAFIDGTTTCAHWVNGVLGRTSGDCGSGGGGTGGFISVEHVFSAGGSFTYTHGTGALYPVVSCYAKSGATSFTSTPLTTTTLSITVPAASDLVCSFAGSAVTVGVQ